MRIDTTAITLAGAQENVNLITTPDKCPRCHRTIQPKIVSTAVLNETRKAQAVFRCTSQRCQELFIANFDFEIPRANKPAGFYLQSIAPWRPVATSFPDTIVEISPNFVAIYNQAIHAEAEGLDQIVGIGLRKSLEFLIKDFAVSQNPELTKEIQRTMLGPCISLYVNDINIKECAKRAAWLGNDETHYIRKWVNQDIQDLKLLIRLTVNWIDNNMLTKKYISEMPSGGV